MRRYWPILVLVVLEVWLLWSNYKPGTWLLGWDNVMPEFNFGLNFKRSVFAVWQEYRGLGLLDGMGHAANMVHTGWLWVMSWVLPANLLRYVFILLMHFLGGVGIYVLLQEILPGEKRKLTALIGSLFYLLNAFTIQMFYVPLEAFAVHFAVLPWLTWAFLSFVHHGTTKKLGTLLVISVLATPQFFVTPLFLPVMVVLGTIGLMYRGERKRVSLGLVAFLVANLFWLLPYVYAIPKVGPIVRAAKINQMSTEEIYRRNQAFGNLTSLGLMRGYALEMVDVNVDNEQGWMMATWRQHLLSPITAGLYLGVLGIVAVGVWSVLQERRKGANHAKVWVAVVAILAVAVGFLGSDIVGLKQLHGLIRDKVPVFGEAFRFTFTKFSLMYAFSYSMLLAYGVGKIYGWLKRVQRRRSRWWLVGLLVMIVYLGYPSFRGEFIYDNLKIKLPDEYRQLFEYMSRENPAGRTALLPQADYWNWKYYSFDLRGSGFTWYGIDQPTLDRAFDPWSNANEQYYWELSRAIYSKNASALEQVFDKYDIAYVILDENFWGQGHGLGLYTDYIKAMLAENPRVTQQARFGEITVYGRSEEKQFFVAVEASLPKVWPAYRWTDNDRAFANLGDYLVGGGFGANLYSFRSLFTKRAVTEQETKIYETGEEILLEGVGQRRWVNKAAALMYDSNTAGSLDPNAVKDCGSMRERGIATEAITEGMVSGLRFSDYRSKSCLSFEMTSLPHNEGYVVVVESRHVAGQLLRIGLINLTAKHMELETFLPGGRSWETTYLILPPLTRDGLGYSVYLTNDAIGRYQSINDIVRVRVYRLPYQELVDLKLSGVGATNGTSKEGGNYSVIHTNPSYYLIKTNGERGTLVLSQAYDVGWKAYRVEGWLERILPFVFGKPIKEQVKVNNWSNGWVLDKVQTANSSTAPIDQEIVIYFLPQLLEWVGLVILGGVSIWCLTVSLAGGKILSRIRFSLLKFWK